MRSESRGRSSQSGGLSTGWAISVSPRRSQHASVLRCRLVRAKSVVIFGALVSMPTSYGKRAQSPTHPTPNPFFRSLGPYFPQHQLRDLEQAFDRTVLGYRQ